MTPEIISAQNFSDRLSAWSVSSIHTLEIPRDSILAVTSGPDSHGPMEVIPVASDTLLASGRSAVSCPLLIAIGNIGVGNIGVGTKMVRILDANTAGSAVGDPVYLKANAGGAGGWSTTIPLTGAAVIIGSVLKVSPVSGTVLLDVNAPSKVLRGVSQTLAGAVAGEVYYNTALAVFSLGV